MDIYIKMFPLLVAMLVYLVVTNVMTLLMVASIEKKMKEIDLFEMQNIEIKHDKGL